MLRKLRALLPVRLRCWLADIRSPAGPRLGAGSYVHRSVQMLGRANVSIGANSVLSEDCWLNVNHRLPGQLAIRIGDHCFIGRRNFISSGALVTIDDFVLTANDCHFLGSTHLVADPMRPVLTTGTSSSDRIVVGPNCFIGAGARVVGNVRIGAGCVIGAGSTVVHDLPPFSQAVGQPAVVRRRYSFQRREWIAASAFTASDESSLPTEDEYRRHLHAQGRPAMPYIAAGADMGNL